MMMSNALAALPLAGLLMSVPAAAQLSVDNTQTPEQLVQNILLGAGVTVSNVTFNGLPGNSVNDQIGSFNGNGSNINIGQGVVMCSGTITQVAGPNNTDALTLGPNNPDFNGDADLEAISQQLVNDKAVLEFDFVPAGDSLEFRFVFGSEEYNEYVCSSFNDVFGFFLSGPGINGPFTGNAINIARVPGTNVPIGINTVNNGSPGAFGDAFNCAAVDPNWQSNSGYFFDNTGGPTVQYDGFTVVLTARALVQCGETYHIKLAIADAFDSALDSGVFLEAGSFSSNSPVGLSVIGAEQLVEGCDSTLVRVIRPLGTTGDLDVQLAITGTTANGTDHTTIPTTVTIPAGANEVDLPVTAFADGAVEGSETVTVTYTFVNACGETVTVSVTLTLNDAPELLLSGGDIQAECTDSLALVVAVAGGTPPLALLWGDGTDGNLVWVTGELDGQYTITATDACGQTGSLSIQVDVDCEVIVPNVFSPNGDGQNDLFFIDGIESRGNTVRIYNRWGQLVFEASNYRNTWDGDDLSDGTYYYEVLLDGDEAPLTGHVTILNN